MEPMTLQQFFDEAWERSSIQVAAQNEYGCFYASVLPEVPGCFIGCALDDQTAEECDSQETSLRTLIANGVLPARKSDANALLNLQGIHDVSPPTLWRERLTQFAGLHNLTIPKVAA